MSLICHATISKYNSQNGLVFNIDVICIRWLDQKDVLHNNTDRNPMTYYSIFYFGYVAFPIVYHNLHLRRFVCMKDRRIVLDMLGHVRYRDSEENRKV